MTLNSQQIREAWADWRCVTTKYVRVDFPGNGRVWSLLVADQSVPAWEQFAQVMADENYLFRESAGGTYNCRKISGSNSWSIHAYALALDLNPSRNPYGSPLRYDYPESFIARAEGIRVNGKQAFVWGGRWSTPDAMHWQLAVAPSDFGDYIPDEEDLLETTKGIQRSLNAAGYTDADGRALVVDGIWGAKSEYAHSQMTADAAKPGGSHTHPVSGTTGAPE